MSTVKERYGLHGTPDELNKYRDKPTQFICGVEYEIESIKGHGSCESFVTIKEDGSLRNNGYEYITRPNSYEESLAIFKRLHDCLTYGEDAFSHRTSIHVHVNVAHMEMPQVKQLVLLYALCEPLFFNFVGKERESSIFCVPLYHTYLASHYKKSTDTLISTWHKYTAFNLCPIPQQGSVEFRHLGGTNDYTRFELWLSSLKSLYDFINNNPKMNVLKELKDIPGLVEQAVPKLLSMGSLDLLKDSILDVKLAGV